MEKLKKIAKSLFNYINISGAHNSTIIINSNVIALYDWNYFTHIQKLEYKFRSNDTIKAIIDEIITRIKSFNHIRITGDSGIGKTRLVYEILNNLYLGQDSFKANSFNYYDAKGHDIDRSTLKTISEISNDLHVIVIDNFPLEFHKELLKNKPQCRIITIDYIKDYEKPTGLYPYKSYILNSKDYESVVNDILYQNYNMDLSTSQISHLVKFTEGNTLLAIQFAEAGIINAELESIVDSVLTKKLIFGRDVENKDDLRVLRIISCFDKLDYPISGIDTPKNQETNQNLKFLSDFLGIELTSFKEIIQKYKNKVRIEQFGNLIVVRPLPLTLRLAIDFWRYKDPNDYKAFIENMPNQYREAMVNQLSRLEGFEFAKDFITEFWGVDGNFSTAEYINTSEGSRIFRSIATVNPSESIKVLKKHFLKSKDEFYINENARQNIVWALERLCFRKETFIEASKILMCIAINEGETYYSNNAKSYFLQLFKIYLAGTEIDLLPRLEVLKWAFNRNEEEYTQLALKAIRRAYSEVGGRFSGAERQGINMPLEDYTPKLYDEIWDYYKELFILLEPFISNENIFQQLAQEAVYTNINNIYNQRLAIEEIIKYLTIISNNLADKVSFYKELHLSIKRNGVNKEFKNEIQNFLDNNLIIEDFKDLLNLYVINTIDDYDESSIEANRIAKKAVNDKIQISEYFDILLNGHQIYTFNFGAKYTELSGYNEKLINDLIVYINSESVDLNISLLHGLISTLNINEKKRVFEIMKSTNSLTPFYCANFLNIDEQAFEYLFELSITKQNTLLLINLRNCLFNFDSEYVIFTLDKIKKIEHGHYIIFDLIYRLTAYVDNVSYDYIKIYFKNLVYDFNYLSIYENNRYGLGFYQWRIMFDKIISEFPELNPIVSHQIVEYLKSNFHDSNNTYIRDIVMKLLISNFNSSWEVFSELLVKDDFYTFYSLFGLNFASRAESDHPLFTNDEVIDKIILWLNGKQKAASWFVSIAPLFEYENNEWNKHTLRLINNFGDDEHFLNELSSNLHSMFSVGSRIPYYSARKELVSKLNNHSIPRVREWSIIEVERYEQRIAEETIYEQENILKFNTDL